MKIAFHCARCHRQALQESGSVNRARRKGVRLFCGRRCAGIARRTGKTKAERIKEKRLYDMEYREVNAEHRKAQKAEYHKRTYDPAKAAVERKKRMARHVEYCRDPKYKSYKRDYDKQHRARGFGPFAECYLILQDLNAEIASRMSRYDIYMANGRFEKYYEKRKQRRLTSEEDRYDRR